MNSSVMVGAALDVGTVNVVHIHHALSNQFDVSRVHARKRKQRSRRVIKLVAGELYQS